MVPREVAEYGEFLRIEVGSTLHGISIGNDDRDEMGICIEPPEYVLGTRKFEHYTFRTAEVRGGEGTPSEPGDLDLVVYSLRKWARLALNGNPTVMLMLYCPESRWVVGSQLARDLQEIAPSFASRSAGHRYLGYIKGQRDRMEGRRGKASMPKNRGDGDRKYLAHMARLTMQGLEFLSLGRIELPMLETNASYCRAIRSGDVSKEEALAYIAEAEKTLRKLTEEGPLPEHPDRYAIDDFLADAHNYWWRRTSDPREYPLGGAVYRAVHKAT